MNPPPQFGIPPAMQAAANRRKSKRKGAPAITKQCEENVWQSTLDALGLEARNSKTKTNSSSSTTTTTTNTTTTDMPEAIEAPAPTRATMRTRSIPDLPLEVQRNIVRHAARHSADLVALSLVSKHFRVLAAEELYRTFHIVFPDDDDISNDSPIDGLAGGLDTFATSDYNYAQHLKEIILETLSGGTKGEITYKDYLYSVSCGKFMNTLLLLTLRKARALETFKWDIRVELSRQVFRALHQINSLQNLHLRMQAGPSMYQIPPAIGSSPAVPIVSSVSQSLPPPPPPHGVVPISPPPGMPPPPTNAYTAGYKTSQKAHQKQLKSVLPVVTRVPPTLSAFRNLKTLSILDMDTYEYMEELKTCIRACSPTLSTLRLSFSESFANKSRRPTPDVHSDDDSDQEDEFGQIIPPPGAVDPNAPTHALMAQVEKKKQDAVLGNILGWEPAPPKAKTLPTRTVAEKEKPKDKKSDEDPKRRFIRSLAPVAARLMNHVKPGSDRTAEGKELISMIAESCKTYLESTEKKKTSTTTSAGSSTAKGTPASSAASGDESPPNGSVATDEPGLFDRPEKEKKPVVDGNGASNPDDIDMDEPEEDVDFEAGAEAPVPESPVKPDIEEPLVEVSNEETREVKAEELLASELEVMQLRDTLQTKFNEIMLRKENLSKNIVKLKQAPGQSYDEYVAAMNAMTARARAITIEMEKIETQLENINARLGPRPDMSEYIRTTRGLTLSNLEIYLVPVRANVLSQTIDLSVLQSITLLNVGPQQPFWNIMASRNAIVPVSLHKIYTDNVTLPFLVFVSQLDRLTELIMFERPPKPKVETTTAKTTVKIEQIRKLALKKHAATLKILVIKNKSTPDWDLDIKATMLLCQRAKNLEELACTIGTKAFHTLLQFFSGLESLRALQAYQFRDVDQCGWLAEGFRKFTVDVVSHHPELKLEYVALDSTIERLVRRKPAPKASTSKKAKGKGKASDAPVSMISELVLAHTSGVSFGNANGTAVPTWEDAIAGDGAGMDSSDDDDDDGTLAKGLRIETVEGLQFCNIPGVRIFEKDILNGSL